MIMILGHALRRGAALGAWRWNHRRSRFLIAQFKGLNQPTKTDDNGSCNYKLLAMVSSPYIVKHSFFHATACDSSESPEEATQVEGVDSKNKDAADLFREWGCSDTDIVKIFERRPSLRNSCIHILQSKLQILSQLGVTSTELVRIVHCRPRFLNCRINVLLNERLQYLEDIFGSRNVLLKAIVRNPSLLIYDFHNKIKPTIAIYESLGLTKKDLITVLLSRPTLIPRTNLDDEKIDCIRKTGVSKESKMYKHVVSLFAVSRIDTILEKIGNLENYGLSEDEIFSLIGRSPLLLTLSVDKIQRNMTFILGTMRLPARVVLGHPFLLYVNLESVLKPRFHMACKMEDMGLVPQIKGSGLLRAMRMSDKRFIKAFISSQQEKQVAEELLNAYNNAKCVRRLAESSKKNITKGFPF